MQSFNPSQVQFTHCKLNWLIYSPCVSIPHRFNSHLSYPPKLHQMHNCFNPSQVQFTPAMQNLKELQNQTFQSLTGSIHTQRIYSQNKAHHQVSIPHRFNSHMWASGRCWSISSVSIPQRFNSHNRQSQFNQLLKQVSIPHRFNSH